MFGFEARDMRFDPEAGSHGEAADPIFDAAVLRRDEIRKAEVGTLDGFVGLLAKEMQNRAGLCRSGFSREIRQE